MIIKLLDGRRYQGQSVWCTLDAQVHVVPFQEHEDAPVTRFLVVSYESSLWCDPKEAHSLPTEAEAVKWAKRLYSQRNGGKSE